MIYYWYPFREGFCESSDDSEVDDDSGEENDDNDVYHQDAEDDAEEDYHTDTSNTSRAEFEEAMDTSGTDDGEEISALQENIKPEKNPSSTTSQMFWGMTGPQVILLWDHLTGM